MASSRFDDHAEQLGNALLNDAVELKVGLKPSLQALLNDAVELKVGLKPSLQAPHLSRSVSKESLHSLIDEHVDRISDRTLRRRSSSSEGEGDEGSEYCPSSSDCESDDSDVQYMPPPPPVKKKRKVSCRKCKDAGRSGLGHISSSMTCPMRTEPLERRKKSSSRKNYTCTACGSAGHIASSSQCPKASGEERWPDLLEEEVVEVSVRADNVATGCDYCGRSSHAAQTYEGCLRAKLNEDM
jgi:hypothetical protein